MRGPASHSYHRRIKWAQAHGTREALDRQFRLAEEVFYPAAETPCLGRIGIEHKRAIDQGGAYLEIANNKRQRPPAGGERDRVILAQLNRPLSEPCHFGNLVRRDRNPAIGLGMT